LTPMVFHALKQGFNRLLTKVAAAAFARHQGIGLIDEKVQEAMGGILFIDEAYSLMPRESSGRDFGQEAIEALLKRMEDHRGEFALIIAGYADEMHRFLDANPGVRSRFNRYLFFDHYNPEELAGIFELFCNKGGFELDETAKKKVRMHMAKAYARRDNAFGNGRYARNIFENTIENQANRIVGVEEITDEVLTTFTEEDIPDFDDSDLGQEDTLDEATLMAMLNLDQPVESIGDEPTDLEEIESGQETEEVVEPEAVAEETAEEAAEEKEIQSESDQDK
ncbi:MAG: AAA family ATPase, partial [Chloroflexota bacterium]